MGDLVRETGATPPVGENGTERVTLGIGSHYQYSEHEHASRASLKPHGLLPVPPQVAEFVVKEEARILTHHGIQLAPETKKRLSTEGTLDYWFRSEWVSYRELPHGVEILAVGPEEIERLRKQLSQDERNAIRTRQI